MKNKIFKLITFLSLTLFTVFSLFLGQTVRVFAESEDNNVYLVWKESDYKTNTDYVLTDTNNDGEYEYTLQVDTDTKLLSYYIEYKDSKYYPNEDGVVDLEKGTYTIYFNPDALYGLYNTKIEEINRYYLMYQDNNYLQNDNYALVLNEDNTSFDEYTTTISFSESKMYSVYVRDVVDNIDYYSNNDHLVKIDEIGSYKVKFAPYNLYDGYNVQISKEDEEIYYLMCKNNNFSLDTSYELKTDEDNEDYEEYYYEISFLEEIDFVYYIYASKAKTKHYPNKEGFLEINKEGDYKVVFSPSHKYYSSDDTDYYTIIEIQEDYFKEADYYFLSAINNYEVCEENKLAFNEENQRFDEYILEIEITEPMNLSYYIYVVEIGESNGINYYPNKTGVYKIDESGKYVVKFALSHAYYNETNEMYYTTITKTKENPQYYLMNIDNDYTMNNDYILSFNEENTDFDEYTCEFETTKDKANYSYFIYDKLNDKRYYPNQTGVVYLEYIDKYIVRFSPTYNYNTDSNDNKYFTSVELKEENYGGYYVIGNLNNYTYSSSDEFKEKYMFSQVTSANLQEGYDYYIELDITSKMINEYETIKYCITDGINRYRGTDNSNFIITETGKYAIYFSKPTENSNANVYYYALKSYDSIDKVSELMFLDNDDNNVYVACEGLTSDMKATLVTKGKYSYIEITQNDKLLAFNDLKVSYYVGDDVNKHSVKIYTNKALTEAECNYSNQFIVFECSSGDGFIIDKKNEGINPIVLSLIISACVIVVGGIVIVTHSLNKKKKLNSI